MRLKHFIGRSSQTVFPSRPDMTAGRTQLHPLTPIFGDYSIASQRTEVTVLVAVKS